MSQCFKTLAALPEGPGLSPSTKQLSVSLVPGGLMICLLASLGTSHSQTPVCNK